MKWSAVYHFCILLLFLNIVTVRDCTITPVSTCNTLIALHTGTIVAQSYWTSLWSNSSILILRSLLWEIASSLSKKLAVSWKRNRKNQALSMHNILL
jgi:hypothetical protein